MDAIVGVWITSVIGAAAFSAAGYVLGQSRKPAAPPAPAPAVLPPAPPPSPPRAASQPKIEAAPESKKPDSKQKLEPAVETIEPAPVTKRASVPARPLNFKTPVAFPPPAFVMKPIEEREERPTVVPDVATQAAVLQSSVVTIPPPQRAPSLTIPRSADPAATRAMIEDALTQVERAAEQTRALEIVKHELERHLEIARNELRNEVVLRAAADARADELADRLARASEEASSLRHRVNMLDRQTKLLRESLKGGRPAAEGRMRRDLDDAEEMRAKLRDVVDKLERASLPPTADAPRSVRPAGDDSTVLRDEIARLASENRTLRAQALGSLPPRQPATRDSAPEVDLAMYEGLLQGLGNVAGLKCAVLADEVGSVVLGRGDLAENLAAFGAYIRDASGRTERLLPLEGVEEVEIRDTAGLILSTRAVSPPSSLSIVLLASADGALTAAKKMIDDRLRLRG
jgi:hypothetical protein